MKTYIKIKKFDFQNSKQLIKKIKKKFILSHWIINTIEKIELKRNISLPIELVSINLKTDLKINSPEKLKDVYKKLKTKGYKLVAPEIAIYSSLYLKKQKPGIWLRFAVPLNSMVDDDGIPHLPKIGHGLNKRFIETYWSYKDAIFHPHNNFIVMK
jgi:hypothetical protein|tara:strand:- start:6465 stop:6932 length:468 start_codon:yes stop_codon:yes gene_type:complete